MTPTDDLNHRLHFIISRILFIKLKGLLPIRGQVTLFLTLCIEEAIAPSHPAKSIDDLISLARRQLQ